MKLFVYDQDVFESIAKKMKENISAYMDYPHLKPSQLYEVENSIGKTILTDDDTRHIINLCGESREVYIQSPRVEGKFNQMIKERNEYLEKAIKDGTAKVRR